MSRETLHTLNTNTLIGCITSRGHAWHYRAAAQGGEPNHYDGFIPAADVDRRLFSFTAEEAPLFVAVPATLETATGVHDDGTPYRLTPITTRKALIHSITSAVLGVHGSGFRAHQFPTLTQMVTDLLGPDIGISSAGVLRAGALGWIEVSIPEAVHLPRHGIAFRPNLLATTAHDGTLATTLKRTVTNVVCDNTHGVALRESGATYRIRHTRHSALRVADARAALNVLDLLTVDFTAHVDALIAQSVTTADFDRFMALAVPMPDKHSASKRATTNAVTKREQMTHLWQWDPRVTPWRGTAWGVVQMVNTHAHHVTSTRGADRGERNTLRAVDGAAERLDAKTLGLLAQATT